MPKDQTVGASMPADPPRSGESEQVPLSSLFLAFLRLGVTAFGGPAMVAYIRDLAVGKKRWLSEESFRDGTALCQSIPGATAMQTAAYVGLRVRGVRGALATFVGFGLPAFLLMLGLSRIYEVSRNIHLVASAFGGLQVMVVALAWISTDNHSPKCEAGFPDRGAWSNAMITHSTMAQ